MLPDATTPFRLAQKVYERELCKRDFWTDLYLHLLSGYVINTRTAFLMGREVDKDATYEAITDPTHRFEAPNCWHIYLAAGEIGEFFRYEPHELPWISYERDNVLRFFDRNKLRAKLCSTVRFAC